MIGGNNGNLVLLGIMKSVQSKIEGGRAVDNIRLELLKGLLDADRIRDSQLALRIQ
ncbi:hypothetical protein D3C73_1574060 [compost metagenome]